MKTSEEDPKLNDSEEIKNCKICQTSNGGPSHFGSKFCESGSLASGGQRSHCSCDTCF